MSEYNLIVEDSIKNIGEKDYRKIWQADPHRNIFTSWDYLSILEQSNCVGQQTGWKSNFFVLKKSDGEIKALAPCFLKYHSYGEYVFDWAWAIRLLNKFINFY